MSDNYAKVFTSMYSGSMYGAGMHVFAVWGWVLAHKDENGLVEINTDKVAHELGGTTEQVESAIEWLMRKDPRSRSMEQEGRRLVKLEAFSYQVVNHAKYRDQGKDRTAYWRAYRKNKNANEAQVPDTHSVRATVAHSCAHVRATEITHADADADADADKTTTDVVVSSRTREEPRGDDNDSPFVSTIAKDVRGNCEKVVAMWNQFAQQPVRSAVELMSVEPAYSALVLGIPPNRLAHDQIVGAVENYRMACRLPKSQAPTLSLGRFLAWNIIAKYLPGRFTLEHYDASRFQRDGPVGESDAEAGLKRLKDKGLL